MNHIGQEAELYALGMLDDNARAGVDAHLLTCIPCTELVGQAEEALAALVDTTQQRRIARRPAWWPLAAAAAFALAASGLLAQNFAMRGELNNDGALLATLVNSHFDHSQFRAPNGAELPAKAIYEHHGKWFEVLADGAPDWHLVTVDRQGVRARVEVPFVRRGAASVASFGGSTSPKSIDIEDGAGRLVGSVTL